MKSIFTSIFILFFIGTSSANHGPSGSVLNLKLFGRGDFTVMLDDVQYTWVDNYLEVGALRPGQHRLKVVETIRNYGPRGAHSVTKRVAYNGRIHIPATSIVWARITPGMQLVVESVQPIRGNGRNLRDPQPSNPGRQGSGNDWYTDRDRDNDDRYEHRDRDYRDHEYRDRDRDNDRRGDHINRDQAAARFSALRQSVSRASFDSDKLLIASQFARTNGILSSEVADLMKLMSFESTRLEFAKNAYTYCLDKENYFLVNESFSFSSSIRQLHSFIY